MIPLTKEVVDTKLKLAHHNLDRAIHKAKHATYLERNKAKYESIGKYAKEVIHWEKQMLEFK